MFPAISARNHYIFKKCRDRFPLEILIVGLFATGGQLV